MATVSNGLEVVLDPNALPPEPVKRWTVAEYHEMIRAGFLTKDDPYELIEGWLLRKMPKNPPHERILRFLMRFFLRNLSEKWLCGCQSPVTLSDGEPEPDLTIFPGPESRYGDGNPTGADVRLVIEIADSSISRDQGIKLQTYARGGIREYWIVDILAREVLVYTSPKVRRKVADYESDKAFGAGTTLRLNLSKSETIELPVDDIFRVLG